MVVVAVSLLSGCRTTKYVPMEKVVYRDLVKHDTLHRYDSIYVRDSVSSDRRGDTVFVDRWHKKVELRNAYRTKIDSFVSRDSIPIPYPVEKELSKWERFQLKYAIWSMGITCALLVVLGFVLFRRIRDARNQTRNKQG